MKIFNNKINEIKSNIKLHKFTKKNFTNNFMKDDNSGTDNFKILN